MAKKSSKSGEASAPKAGAPKAAAKKSAAPKAEASASAAAPKKKAGEVKLNDLQKDFLKKIHGAGEAGYRVGQKVEQRTIEALERRKLLKKGAKHKESGTFHYVLTKAGQKHLTTG